MTARDRAARGSDEDGRIMLLTAGMVALALMIVGMVASATAVHLDRKHLFDLADAIAADAADAVPPERLLTGGAPAPEGEAVLPLTAADVEASARAYLAAHPDQAAGLDGLRVVEASAPDGRTAQVGLTATSHPPLLRWFTDTVGGGFTVAATSSARAG